MDVSQYCNCYYKLLITPNGISVNDKQCIGELRTFNDYQGTAKFSHDGSKYARADNYNQLTVMDFDRCTGQFSNPIKVIINDTSALLTFGLGVEFSPNNKLLYISTSTYIYQLNLENLSSASIPQIIGTVDNFQDTTSNLYTTFHYPTLAANGKIYCSTVNGTRYMHIIENPNVLGMGCNFVNNGLFTEVVHIRQAPNFANHQLGSLSGSPCDTISSTQKLQKEKSRSLSANPNPANESFYLNYNNKENTSLQIVDAYGKIIYSQVLYSWFTSQFIDCSNWPNGVYVAQVKSQTSGELKGSCKVVVLR